MLLIKLKSPSVPNLMKVFIMNTCWVFSNAFSASIDMFVQFCTLAYKSDGLPSLILNGSEIFKRHFGCNEEKTGGGGSEKARVELGSSV